ncbi:hypothetical protein TKK_0009496 [Trichogramma kaykai]
MADMIDIVDILFRYLNRPSLMVCQRVCRLWDERARARIARLASGVIPFMFEHEVDAIADEISRCCLVVVSRYAKEPCAEIVTFKAILSHLKDLHLIESDNAHIQWTDIRSITKACHPRMYKCIKVWKNNL